MKLVRRHIKYLCIIASALLLAAIAAYIAIIAFRAVIDINWLETTRFYWKSKWLTISYNYLREVAPWIVASIGMQAAFAAIVYIVVFAIFRRKAYHRLALFAIFLASITIRELRIVHLNELLAPIHPELNILITRLFYFTYITSYLSLLFVNLSLFGYRRFRISTAVGSSLLVAFAVAYGISIDRHILPPNLIHTIGQANELQIAVAIIGFAIGINTCLLIILKRRLNTILMSLATLLLYAGQEILLRANTSSIIICGFAMTVTGTSLFIWQNHKKYSRDIRYPKKPNHSG